VCYFRDVSAQVRAREAVLALNAELRRANQDLEQFAYSASHDLQEPLRSVKIYSELLAAQCREKLNGEEIEFLDYLRTGATRMEMLVRDLLTYTQATRLDKPSEAVDATSALNAALGGLAGAISESGARIDFETLPLLPVQGTQLQLIFQNLIGNAIKYRRKGEPPRVRVLAERQNEQWLFSVSDNGIGIEAEYKELIFRLFKRLHTGDEYSGTGIGLALCQRIVERNHGSIWVESELGKGSTFYFTLPV
jgi:light-regulated signal transduction histidine kinase (bacteriophytochrome)